MQADSDLQVLAAEGERLEALAPERVVLRWFNYHLARAGYSKEIKNFGSDIQDSTAYAALLKQIAPAHLTEVFTLCTCATLDSHAKSVYQGIVCEPDKAARAAKIIEAATNAIGGQPLFVSQSDIVSENSRLNLAFIATLLNNIPMSRRSELEVQQLENRVQELESTAESLREKERETRNKAEQQARENLRKQKELRRLEHEAITREKQLRAMEELAMVQAEELRQREEALRQAEASRALGTLAQQQLEAMQSEAEKIRQDHERLLAERNQTTQLLAENNSAIAELNMQRTVNQQLEQARAQLETQLFEKDLRFALASSSIYVAG